MATPNLAITHILATQAQKEVTANQAFDYLDEAMTDLLTVVMADANQTLSSSDALYHMVFICTGALTANRNLVVPTNKKLYIVKASTTAAISSTGSSIVVKTPSGTGITVTTGAGFVILYCDGVNVIQITLGNVPSLAFTQLTDAPASYSGDGGYAVQVNAGATAVEFVAKPYDIPMFIAGAFANSQVVFAAALPRAVKFLATLPGSYGNLLVAATASTVFSIKKNGSQFGTLTFAAAGTVGTFAAGSDTSFAAGDILSIVAPASADGTAAGLGLSLIGIRV